MKRNLTRLLILASVLAGPCFPALAADQFALISAGSDWKYWDQTDYPGDAWRTLGFDDSSWNHGPAMLGFGDANGLLPTTVIGQNGEWTAYFRHVFTVANPGIYTNLLLSLQRDDGAVVWLNGKDVWRNNMPQTGPILPNTPASSVVGGADEATWWTTNASPTNLVVGDNILAVEVHQINNLTSSDLIFDFALEGLNDNARPVATIPNNPSFSEAPVTIQLTATVEDDGLPLPANVSDPDPNDPHKLRWGWSVASVPAGSTGIVWSGNPTNGEAFTYEGSVNAPGTLFTCNPTATFDVPGVYALNFTASDGEKEVVSELNVSVRGTGTYRQLGYMYLSPLPEAEYCSTQTRFVLVRFNDVAPSDVANLDSSFITVTGASSGNHPGTAHVASDGRTVIFTISGGFSANELVTVALNPELRPGAEGTLLPYVYRFMVSTHLPDFGTITARGDTPPDGVKENAFDSNAGTKWVDSVVPNGSSNFSWIQYLYPGTETHVVNQYAITSAADFLERDPCDWRFYGVDQSSNLVLLDTQTDQAFSGRGQQKTYTISNATAYRGYRLEITRVNDPASAGGVQLAELKLIEPSGSILREYWTGISGNAVSDLTNNAGFPNNPTGSDQLSHFEAPIDWADNYGTRIRGYITAPNTGDFVFWISSDDNSQLFLSTDADPVNKRLIASVSGWTNPREWNKYAEQKSASISLTGGQEYYVEALQKEGTGGDSVAVGWAKPGQPTTAPSEVIPGSVLSPWTGGPSGDDSAPRALVRVPRGYPPDSGPRPLVVGKPTIMPNGVSVPSDFPNLSITINDNPDPEYIFIDTRGGNGKPYNVIFDNSGSPIWYRLMPDERRDMKVQHNGVLTMLARTGGYRFVGLDTNYNEIATYRAVNGYGVDEHELQVLADGTYFLIGLASQTVDMSRYVAGGNPAASVTEQVIQGFTPAGELIFQWRAWDHLDVRDQQQFINLTSGSFDFPHMNAIDVDTDGNILLSSRNTSEVTKIDRDTGEIIWRLGGVHDQFTYLNDPLNGTRNQHAARMTATNRYLIFDNGNLHNPPVSRGVEYELDPTNMTARIVWQYPATPTTSLYSYYMGNTQRLPNGNTLINWAIPSLSKLTEVRPDGTKAYEMNWADHFEAYRVWRCAWQGMALSPNLLIEAFPDRLTLMFNKFGDTNVAFYRIYGGTAPNPTNVLATSTATLANLTQLENQRQYYFRVTAVDRNGTESAFSDEKSVFVNIVKPGENMVLNGDFSQGTDSWTWNVSGTAAATWSIVNGSAYIDITSPGTALADIQLRQAGLKLVQGREYVLAFDAWAAAPRVMEVRVGQDQSPYATYKLANPSLTSVRKRFSYPFVMQNATDLNARVAFNLGALSTDVYLDDVALFMVAPGDFNRDGLVDLNDLSVFTGQWLKQGSGQSADLNADGKVDFKDFSIFGQNWSGAESTPLTSERLHSSNRN